MGANAIARSTVQREASSTHYQHVQNALVEDVISAEKAFIAAMRLLLDNGLTCACSSIVILSRSARIIMGRS